MLDIVFIFHAGGRLAFTTATLGLIGRQRLRLGITTVGDGHDALFFGDQVSQGQIETGIENLGTTLVAKLSLNAFQLFANHFHQTLSAGQDADQFTDLQEDFLVLGQQLLVLKTGQTVQAQFKNRLCLLWRQEVLTVA